MLNRLIFIVVDHDLIDGIQRSTKTKSKSIGDELFVMRAWASCQIRKMVDYACAGNAGNIFPATTGYWSRHASRHVRDARPGCMPGSLASGFLWSRCRGKRSRHSRRMRNAQFCVCGKWPIVFIHEIWHTWHTIRLYSPAFNHPNIRWKSFKLTKRTVWSHFCWHHSFHIDSHHNNIIETRRCTTNDLLISNTTCCSK